MKSRTVTSVTAMTLFAALSMSARLAAQEQQGDKKENRSYRVIDLGTLGGTFATGNGVNNEGWVTGSANLAGDQNHHAFLWVNGVKTDLGTFGGPNSEGKSLNARGQVVGNAETSIPDPTGEDFCGNGTMLICTPFLWQKEVMTPLATLGGTYGFANDINERGDAVGTAQNAFPDTTCPGGVVLAQTKPVIWARGEIKELPTIDGDPDGVVNAINDKGQAVGQTFDCTSSSHGVLWQNGTVTDLGTLDGLLLVPTDINSRGQVVGNSFSPDGAQPFRILAFLWQNGVATNLGTLAPDVFSFATGINNKGQVIGFSCDDSFSCRAFLWQDGTMTELNTLVHDPNAPFLENANSINSRGQIAGKTTVQGTDLADAFLATPSHGEAIDETAAPAAASQRQRVASPEIRRMLRQRLGPRYHILPLAN